jgi:hypothetical protein
MPSALFTPPALELAARQVAPPGDVVGALHLGMDEAVDGLVADDVTTVVERQPAGDLLGRPAEREAVEDALA